MSDTTLIDFDSDNSQKDPNYIPSNEDSLPSIDSDNELTAMGEILEDNFMNMPPLTTSIAPEPEKYNNDNRKSIKRKRNTGQSYINKNGKEVKSRRFIPLDNKCRKQCGNKISFSEQEAIFKSYWNLGSYNQRILFIGGLMEIVNCKFTTLQKHVTKPRQRNHHIKYFLPVNGKNIDVCQKCFIQCFDESESYLKTIVKKKLEQDLIEFCDHRGSKPSKNKTDSQTEQKVIDHINSFPAHESHYTRRDSSCKYFDSNLNLSLMYKLYREKEKEKLVSMTKYSNIFKSKFLSLFIFCIFVSK